MKTSLALVLVLLLAAPVGASAAGPARFDADFRRDPSRQGFVVTGADDGRFAWSRGRALSVALDSNAPGSRLAAPLGFTLDGTTPFHAEADVVIDGVVASPDDFFQLGFGLVGLQTTGLNRTGTSLPGPPFFVDDSDVFDSVELAYFPNVTFFGGPFLQPTVFGAERGSAFANFAANFGPTSDLGDNGAGEITELPQGRLLRFVLDYDACAQELTTRVIDMSGLHPEELATGIVPLALATLNATGTFTVDAFAIHAYQDLADFDPSTRSLQATLTIERVTVERGVTIAARILPRALNLGARAPARVVIEGADSGASVVLVESGGVATSIPLATVPGGPGLVADLPRGMAVPPLSLSVSGCVVPVAVPRIAPR